MKKILLGTTAVIALGTMTTEAFAADKMKLALGGFMRQYVGITNSDEVAATTGSAARDKDISQWTNSEVYFDGSTVLDSGIKVAAHIEMEADGAVTTNIDRSYLTVSSDAMGAVMIGHGPHYANGGITRRPTASNMDWGDFANWGGVATSGTASSAVFAQSAGLMDTLGGDSAKLKYTSPTFSGVTVGASYSAAETGNASNARRVAGTQNDGYSYGVKFSGDLSGAAVKADLTRMNLGTTNTETTHAGLTVGMAGFTVGGGYSDVNDTATGSSARDGNIWELGVAYKTGPYAVSASYMASEEKATAATAGDDKDKTWSVAATYDMGAGVALTAEYFNAKANPEGTGTTTATGKSATISGVIAGIEVGF